MRRIRCVSLAAVVLAAIPGAAALAVVPSSSSHQVRLDGAIETLSSTGPIGRPGVMDTDVGILDGSIVGSVRWHGALRQVVTWQTGLRFTATGTAYDGSGAIEYGLSGRFAPQPGGGIGLSALMTVHGGTGRFRSASGHLSVTGTATVGAGTTKSTLRVRGALRFSRHG